MAPQLVHASAMIDVVFQKAFVDKSMHSASRRSKLDVHSSFNIITSRLNVCLRAFRLPKSAVKRVAVIGAGPAGAITIDALVQEQAFDVVRVFERRHEAGGCW